MKVIPVNFGWSAPASVDTEQVARLAKIAAAALGRHTGRVVKLRTNEAGSIAIATVTGNDYRLAITVGSYSTLRRRPADEAIREWQARRDAAPRAVLADVVADPEWLIDGAFATSGPFGAEHAFVEVATTDEAVAWVHKNCHRVPIDRVTTAELAEWRKKTVTVRDPGDQTKVERIKLNEAVKIFGPIYGYEISVAVMVANHALSFPDARAIVAAVKKLLPRRIDREVKG